MAKPTTVEKELESAKSQIDTFNDSVNAMTLDRMNQTPVLDVEPQTKLSQKEIERSKDIYLKPHKSIGSKEKFNERFREDYNFAKEYVQFIAENKEIIGEEIEIWTKPFPGLPAEFWKVPTNKPIWGPRHLAEQITKAKYHRLNMQQSTIVGADGLGSYYGQMTVDKTIERLTAIPVSSRKSIFMSAGV